MCKSCFVSCCGRVARLLDAFLGLCPQEEFQKNRTEFERQFQDKQEALETALEAQKKENEKLIQKKKRELDNAVAQMREENAKAMQEQDKKAMAKLKELEEKNRKELAAAESYQKNLMAQAQAQAQNKRDKGALEHIGAGLDVGKNAVFCLVGWC